MGLALHQLKSLGMDYDDPPNVFRATGRTAKFTRSEILNSKFCIVPDIRADIS